MLIRSTAVVRGTTALAAIISIALLSSLIGCGGGSSSTTVTPPTPPPTTQTGIQSSAFGMQCGNGDTADCEGPNDTIVWPSTQAQPGLLRLHDAGTHWSQMNPANNSYDWGTLDKWLDLIAQHQPIAVIQVFTWTPCWDSTVGTCGISPDAPTGTNGIPSDLTASGSPTFNAFVTAFTQHCSPAGNCVANLIKYYEMWNEWNQTFHWTGTMAQVYQMVKPAVALIRTNVPNAVILMPSTTRFSQTGNGFKGDFQNWLNYENANGRISDWVDWHVYLTDTETTTATPEQTWSIYNGVYLSVQSSTSGWASTPWANTETNFNGSPELNYSCPSAEYNPDDCTGQIVRWQILHDSNGASSLDWYKWNQTVGSNSQYESAYYWMMQYLRGGKFTGPASSTGSGTTEIWSAPFAESNGTAAMFVWTPSETGAAFTVPAGYTSYRDLTGISAATSASQQINISTQPVLLEQ